MSRDALVVGINTYWWGGLDNLEPPARDAEAMAQRLEEYGDFRVWRLPEFHDPFDNHARKIAQNQEVTVEQLEDALIRLFNPDSQSKQISKTALFFFSGHGLRRERGISEGYLATSDVNPEQRNWGLSLKWLGELLKKSPVQEQIVWLDCCYSGAALNLPDTQDNQRSLFLIASSREFEEAHIDIGGEHSVLTTALLKGLDPNRQHAGKVTDQILIESINNQLKRELQKPLWILPNREILLTGKPRDLSRPNLEGKCPYKGLESFGPDDADYFFGREDLTRELLGKVRIEAGNFVAVLGASGSGKSSVVQAGLIHRLQQGKLPGSERWRMLTLTPGSHPLESLAYAFLDPNADDIHRADQLQQVEAAIDTGSSGLARLVQASKAPRTLLFIDQFEEVFTFCQNLNERQKFFNDILGALEQTDEKLCLVIAMRADFMGKCAEYGELSHWIKDHMTVVRPMTVENIQRVIREPAKQVGLRVEEELVKQILTDLSLEGEPNPTEETTPIHWEPGSLPLLQYTLVQLWQDRTIDRLTLDSYVQLGGVKEALEKRANQVYQGFTPQEQQVAKHIFLALTHLGEGTEDTRRRVFKRDLVTPDYPEPLIESVIQTLASKRLIVTGQVQAKGSDSVRDVVDIAHEALIRHWRRLRQWVNSNREALRTARKLEADAQDWQRQGKPATIQDVAYLLQGPKLNQAELFLKEYSDLNLLSGVAQEFIDVSQQVNAEIEQREKNRKRRRILGFFAFFSVVTMAAVGFGVLMWRNAQQQQQARQRLQTVFLGTDYPSNNWSNTLNLLLSQANDFRTDVDKFKGQADPDQALNYYNQNSDSLNLAFAFYSRLLTQVVGLERNLKQNPGNVPLTDLEIQDLQEEVNNIKNESEQSLSELISTYRMPRLETQLETGKFGEILTTGWYGDQFTQALRTTYDILMLRVGADVNQDGDLQAQEAEQIPCCVLTEIENLWRESTDDKCGWYEPNSDRPDAGFIDRDCSELGGITLAFKLFGQQYDAVIDRLEQCPEENR
jgi:energy-coupling factor transporter ATP-binding protein EcfA2